MLRERRDTTPCRHTQRGESQPRKTIITQIKRKVKRVRKMSTDCLIEWMEEEWCNAPTPQKKEETDQGPDMEDYAPWNKGRV
jgi:hypothetical protein